MDGNTQSNELTAHRMPSNSLLVGKNWQTPDPMKFPFDFAAYFGSRFFFVFSHSFLGRRVCVCGDMCGGALVYTFKTVAIQNSLRASTKLCVQIFDIGVTSSVYVYCVSLMLSITI